MSSTEPTTKTTAASQ